MINFWVAFRNPFPVRPFRAIRCWSRQITTNKTVEFQISRYAWNWLELQVDLNWRQIDHAGPWLMIGVFGLQVDLRMYDHRHWDDQTNDWKS